MAQVSMPSIQVTDSTAKDVAYQPLDRETTPKPAAKSDGMSPSRMPTYAITRRHANVDDSLDCQRETDRKVAHPSSVSQRWRNADCEQ
jgi:hypothetical protein